MNVGTMNVFHLYVHDRITSDIFIFTAVIFILMNYTVTDYLLVTLGNGDGIGILSDIYIHIILIECA